MGDIKPFTVTLSKDTVKRAKAKLKRKGAKLSPVINVLLEKWIKEQEEAEEEQ